MQSNTPVKKTGGKGLGWNDSELLSLAQAAPQVCQDPAVGSQMTRKDMGERLRKKLVENTLRPSDACTMEGSKDHRDNRRWDGRSGDACYRKWISMRADCTTLNQIKRRIIALKMTGNFDNEDYMRMALVEFSVGKQVLGSLYDIGNNKEYSFNNKFEFQSSFSYLPASEDA